MGEAVSALYLDTTATQLVECSIPMRSSKYFENRGIVVSNFVSISLRRCMEKVIGKSVCKSTGTHPQLFEFILLDELRVKFYIRTHVFNSICPA